MAQIIDMPKLSDTMTVGTLVKWLKKEGDPVKTGDILAEVETDKATMELESFFDGTLLKIFSPEGSQVPIGVALCAVGKPGETVEAPKPPEPAQDDGKAKPPAEPKAPAPAEPVSTPQPNPASAGDAAPSAAPAPATPPKPQTEAPRIPNERIRISPLARKFAREKGIDYTRLQGSGRGGRIVRADIIAAAENPSLLAPASTAPTAAGGPSSSAFRAPHSAFSTGPIQEERTVVVGNMRATIARRLLEAKTTIPHFYLDIEVDAEPLLVLRQQLNAALEKQGVKLSVNDFILKASAEALRRVPAVNASWEGTQIRYFGGAHVSFAVAIEDGLITPVIRDAHNKSVFQISAEAKTLGKRAKEKKLAPAEFTGGTFCVSNLGMMGITKFNPIINPPNSAILGVGTTVAKPVVKNGQIVAGQTMGLTLSCDHRVVDGALGAQYLAALKQLLEAPALLLV
ncbi:pyruvate dehydrogenase E2 component (dihydrolipoamide acetyltransferase) [Ereboglobus sp. PH5-5]|uniref:pyruvate dehydrogenase complex dihydrolipoamide acetyltransferase n=1 Tax=Ereboglobus sp. PH5-5 TaxID=2940529 RepID=UPI00240606EB|nr:pyruvate dehydrogenase complex dihydrolipoamide acetyltransferase [Ereboglobus sp. PH5-5]MDF9833267.1 pyruvate dehydrogenase E2 component (dihydrolipoamide acetyltransferase) [Ereboglobus sp. PH5-5]